MDIWINKIQAGIDTQQQLFTNDLFQHITDEYMISKQIFDFFVLCKIKGGFSIIVFQCNISPVIQQQLYNFLLPRALANINAVMLLHVWRSGLAFFSNNISTIFVFAVSFCDVKMKK